MKLIMASFFLILTSSAFAINVEFYTSVAKEAFESKDFATVKEKCKAVAPSTLQTLDTIATHVPRNTAATVVPSATQTRNTVATHVPRNTAATAVPSATQTRNTVATPSF